MEALNLLHDMYKILIQLENDCITSWARLLIIMRSWSCENTPLDIHSRYHGTVETFIVILQVQSHEGVKSSCGKVDHDELVHTKPVDGCQL